ncbi:aminoacetone oxidase family FAD-binding enzyme, partial [Candidatus Saccharibacteria bacterium]|nr:aminoacetone oxidase family FAD-binding enzyme [Candidatus Saccharibacteria bacterium]
MNHHNTNKIQDYDVAIIGGGASGMMAAISAARNGASVVVLEKNLVLGKKLSITGGGRCNILNAEEDKRLLLANYGSAEKYLYSAFSKFGMEEARDFFESIGLRTKVEAKKRAFPTTELARDVTNALVRELNKLNVEIITNSEASQIYAQGGYIKYVLANKQRYLAKNYILSTGGASYAETGSTGDGFKWLKQLGHAIKEPTPNITPLACKDTWVRQVSGVTAK